MNKFDELGEDLEFENLLKVKTTLTHAIGRSTLIDVIRTLVDQSEGVIDFVDEMKREFIDPYRPEFALVVDIPKAMELGINAHRIELAFGMIKKNNVSDHSVFTGVKDELINKLIMLPYSEFLSGLLKMIINGEESDLPSNVEELVKKVYGSLEKPESLKGSINEIFVDKDEDGEEKLHFTFTTISSMMHSKNPEDLISVDPVVRVEVIL